MNSSSFKIGAFSKFNEPIKIQFCQSDYEKTNITYLDEHVFESFFNVIFDGPVINNWNRMDFPKVYAESLIAGQTIALLNSDLGSITGP